MHSHAKEGKRFQILLENPEVWTVQTQRKLNFPQKVLYIIIPNENSVKNISIPVSLGCELMKSSLIYESIKEKEE